MKDFFDRSYYAALDRLNGRPYAALVCAGSDGSNAARQIARIATGWRLREIAPPLIVCTHAQTTEAILAPKVVPAAELARGEELGAAFATGLAMGASERPGGGVGLLGQPQISDGRGHLGPHLPAPLVLFALAIHPGGQRHGVDRRAVLADFQGCRQLLEKVSSDKAVLEVGGPVAVVACGPGELGGRDDAVGGMEVGLEHRPVAFAQARQDVPEGRHVGLGLRRRRVGGGQLGHALVHEGAQLDEILVDAAAADFEECLAPLDDTTTELPLKKAEIRSWFR
jgi:hypothetical protein